MDAVPAAFDADHLAGDTWRRERRAGFLQAAFGDTVEEFADLLLRPHDFIFNRDWYETRAGKAQFEEYSKTFKRPSAADRAELLNLISSLIPANSRIR